VGDIVWVEYQGARSREWVECEVTALRETLDGSDGLAFEYQVKLVKGSAPGKSYEKGRWLPPNRLRDERDRGVDRPDPHEAKTTGYGLGTLRIESPVDSRAARGSASNIAQTIPTVPISTREPGSRLGDPPPALPAWQREVKKRTAIDQPRNATCFTPGRDSGASQITDPQPSDHDSEEVTGADEEGIDNDSVVTGHKMSAGDSGYGTASVVDSNTVYDGQSVYSDGEQETVPKPVRPILIKLVADEIRKNLDEGVLESISAQDHGADLISGSILGFAGLLEVELVYHESDTRRKATRFVRHHRTDIAAQMMKSKNGLKVESAAQQPLEDIINGWDSAGAGPPEMGEPSEQIWHQSTTDPEQTCELDLLTLSDVPEAQRYLTKSPQFEWLLERIRRLASLNQTGDEYSNMQTTILKAVDNDAIALELMLDWDPLTLLLGQYHEGSFSRTIVYSGSQSTCYATTVEEYVHRVWPDCHPFALRCIDQAMMSSDHTASISSQDLGFGVKFHDRETSVILSRRTSGNFQSRNALLEVELFINPTNIQADQE
jgi:hypothetical protein